MCWDPDGTTTVLQVNVQPPLYPPLQLPEFNCTYEQREMVGVAEELLRHSHALSTNHGRIADVIMAKSSAIPPELRKLLVRAKIGGSIGRTPLQKKRAGVLPGSVDELDDGLSPAFARPSKRLRQISFSDPVDEDGKEGDPKEGVRVVQAHVSLTLCCSASPPSHRSRHSRAALLHRLLRRCDFIRFNCRNGAG
jgi:hypothetical protein